MIKVLNVGDVCILTLWKLEFTMDIFEIPIYNGLLRQTLHQFNMSNIYCFLRDAHRHLKKCISKVLQLLQEGLKNRIVREKVFSAISQKSWVRSYDRVLYKESSSLQLFLNRTPSQVFCRDICKIVQNSYSPEHLGMVALLSIKS